MLKTSCEHHISVGDDCENNYDFCQESPCHELQTCVDKTPTEAIAEGVEFDCGPCPEGYDEVDNDCFGK